MNKVCIFMQNKTILCIFIHLISVLFTNLLYFLFFFVKNFESPENGILVKKVAKNHFFKIAKLVYTSNFDL